MEKEVLNTSMMIQVININPNCGGGVDCALTILDKGFECHVKLT